MLIGAVLILIGFALAIENKPLAAYFARERRRVFSDFTTSTGRQNIAIIGVFLVGAGIAAFVFL
jgi:hypothetical protein